MFCACFSCFQSYAENENECPACLPNNKKILDIIKSQVSILYEWNMTVLLMFEVISAVSLYDPFLDQIKHARSKADGN
jgi:hypothetical protein